MKLTDEMIDRAAEGYERSLLDSLEGQGTAHDFSPAFEGKMRRLIRRREQSTAAVYFKRAMCAILAMVLCVGAFLMFYADARAAVVDWICRQYARSTYYGPTDGVYTHINPSRELPDYYQLDWLPEGYSLTAREVTNENGSVIYRSAGKDDIALNYYFATRSTHVYVSNEGYDVRYVSVHGGGADLYWAAAEDSPNKLVWYSADKTVIFVLTAPFGQTELIRMAESVVTGKETVLRYDFGWLPEGCTFESCMIFDKDGILQYLDRYCSIRLLYQYNTTLGGIYADQEVKTVTVNGYTAYLHVTTYQNMILSRSLIWKDEARNTVFQLSADCTEEELVKIAENIISSQ